MHQVHLNVINLKSGKMPMGMPSDQFDKYMKGDVTGWTAYLALEKVLKSWYELSGEEYAEWLYTSLMSDPALMIDWANSLEEAIQERGENNTEQTDNTKFPLPQDFIDRHRKDRSSEKNK